MTTVSDTSSSSVLSADQLLSLAKTQAGGVGDLNTGAGGLTSPADLLKRAQDAANGIIDPPIVQNISPAASSLTPAKPAAPVPYTQQDWYIKAKVAQLKGQISLYSTLPGLDAGGSIMASLTKQVNDLVNQQKAKLKAADDKAAAAQKKLDLANAGKDQTVSAGALLAKAQGTDQTPVLSDAVNALLKQAQQQSSGVNTLA
jgi:hypothetical protein